MGIDFVIILNEGRMVASGTPAELCHHVAASYFVECVNHPTLMVLLPQLVNHLPGVTMEHYEESEGLARFRLRSEREDPRREIFKFLVGAGIEIQEMTRTRITLEDVFVHYIAPAPAQKTAVSSEVMP